MHSCKGTQEQLIDAELSDISSDLLEEVGSCEVCQRKFDQLVQVLHSTQRLFGEVELSETYLRGYHHKLQTKLAVVNSEEPGTNLLRRLFFSSIRVPVPIGMAALVLLACTFFFVSRDKAKTVIVSQPQVVQVPVEVPVVQEKIVTRVVYRNRRVSPQVTSSLEDSILAQKRKATEPASLMGFKPLDEIKLTVIKGGSPDEK